MGKLLSLKKVRNILILAALDGSESSKNALRQTIRFARKENCGVTAVTVLPAYEGELEIGLMKNIQASFKKPGEKILADARRIALEEGVEIETILAEGNAHEAIIDVAVEKNCDLIAMGRRGFGSIQRALMGSVTARVIGYSPIDVLVMPQDTILKWDNILLAVDGSKYSEVASNRAISMAHTYGRWLNILSVVDVPSEAYAEAPDAVEKMVESARETVEAVARQATPAKLETYTYIREGEAHEKILNMADELQANMICLGSHGRTGLRRLLMGSVTEKVIGGAKVPVLVIKSH